ncbi:MAG: hypothetical protein N3G21_00090 [Candidatus Hydrogenedentes bacterium]|nr:hypothetical protein [Candidatus Hydrogenedentota bacterium]
MSNWKFKKSCKSWINTYSWTVILLIFIASATSADRTILPNEDVAEVIMNSPVEEKVFLLPADIVKPTIYSARSPIIVNREISIVGTPGSIAPVTFLPIDVVLSGNTVWDDVVSNGDFESSVGLIWKQSIDPPDPVDPSYTNIVQENTLALSPSHLALFKGVAEEPVAYQISQNFTLPSAIDLDAHIWQDSISLSRITEAVDEIQSAPTIFPYGREPGILRAENTLPLSVGLPDLSNLLSAFLSFEVMRDISEPGANDRLEMLVVSGDRRVSFTVPLLSISQTLIWFPRGFDIIPLLQLYNIGDRPNFSIRIQKYGTVPIYIDNIRITLQTTLGSIVIPLVCGDFEGPVCTPWIGEGEIWIVMDPSGGTNRCLRLGLPPLIHREVWVELFVRTDRFSGSPRDNLQVLFDGFMPTAFFVEEELGNLIPMPRYLPGVVSNRDEYVKVLAQIPPPLTLDGIPHTISIRSTVSPSAESPDSVDPNTTVFSVDDLDFLVGTIANLREAEMIYSIPNANFEGGNDGNWRLSYINPNIPGRGIEDLISSEGGRSGPFCARLGGLPPAKVSFYVYPNNVDSGNDYFKVWIGPDETNTSKIICDSRVSGFPSQGEWSSVEKWLVSPLLESFEDTFSLHIKGRVKSSGFDSFILFDDFCVSPYGGWGDVSKVYNVCESNIVRNPSFEVNPDSEWSKNEVASRIGPVHCYDLAYPEDCLLPVPARTGFRAVWLASIPEEIVLSFWLKVLGGQLDPSPELEVLVDDQVVRVIGAGDQQYWNIYSKIVLKDEIRPFVDGNVHKLTFRVSDEECSNSSVKFLLDDICLGYEVLMRNESLECLNPLLVDGGFELGWGTLWNALPSVRDVVSGGPIGFPDAHTGAWYAELKHPKPDRRVLWQDNIMIPPSAEFLNFYLMVQKGAHPERAKLSLHWDSISAEAVWSISGDVLEEGVWLEQKVPLPIGITGSHSLYFVYEACRENPPTIFMVDNITLQRSNFPLIQVEPGGKLCLENLSLARGTIGILNLGGKSKIHRVFIGSSLDKGMETHQGSETLLSQSVIHSVRAQAIENRGDLVVFQSTIRDNGSGIENYGGGRASVMSSIIENQVNDLYSELEGGLVSGWNCVDLSKTSGITTVGDPITVRPEFVDTPWVGKLRYPVPARVSLDTIVNNYVPDVFKAELKGEPGCFSGPIVDFENDVRDTVSIQVGADEITIAGTELFWAYCRVSPVVPRVITGRNRDIGIGNNFTVEVGIRGPSSLANAVLYLAPEEFVNRVINSANPMSILEELPPYFKQPVIIEGVDNQRGRANFVIQDLFFVDNSGNRWTTNGRARLYLRVGSILMGIGVPEEYRVQFPPADSEFVIDTVPPRLSLDIYNAGVGSVITQSNDVFSPPSGRYPSDWCPGSLAPRAYSSGLVSNQDDLYPHVFFNNPEGSSLNFTVSCAFYDPYPEDNAEERVVEVSGFIVNQSIQPVTNPQTVSDLLLNGPVFPGFELGLFRTLGCARWVFLNDINRVLNYSPNPQVNYVAYPIGVEGFRNLGVVWELSNLSFGQDWHMRFKFDVKDLSGNRLVETDQVQDGINIWWLLYPVAEKTSVDRVGTWTESPRLEWTFRRSASEVPEKADTCYPLFGVRIWSALNPFDYINSPWVPVGVFGGVGNWGWIKNRTSLDKNTPIYVSDTNFITLNDIITAKESCGALLMATVIGADEAGNLQAGYAGLSTSQLQNLAIVENSGVPYMIWRNPCGLDIDTRLEVRTWWNRIMNVPFETLRFINYNLGERDFGSAGRVPLPSLEDVCDYRIEVKLTMTNVLPSDTFAVSNYGFDIQIFEDGKMVGSGVITMIGGRTSAEICIPTDFITIPNSSEVGYNLNWYSQVGDFLNKPPKKCGDILGDRLGDEGSTEDGFRKREVKYDFVVRAFVQDVGTGAVVTDETPSKFTLVVYPPRGDLERGLRGPAYPKEEQKIKIYKRDF